jgi:hypothetical protein
MPSPARLLTHRDFLAAVPAAQDHPCPYPHESSRENDSTPLHGLTREAFNTTCLVSSVYADILARHSAAGGSLQSKFIRRTPRRERFG